MFLFILTLCMTLASYIIILYSMYTTLANTHFHSNKFNSNSVGPVALSDWLVSEEEMTTCVSEGRPPPTERQRVTTPSPSSTLYSFCVKLTSIGAAGENNESKLKETTLNSTKAKASTAHIQETYLYEQLDHHACSSSLLEGCLYST